MKKRAPTLIQSLLTWHLADAPVPRPLIPVLAERAGTQLKTPPAKIIVDTREQNLWFDKTLCHNLFGHM